MAPELKHVYSADEYFEYADFKDLDSCAKALDDLESYMRAEGPFDAVMAFSQGASLAVSYIAQRMGQDLSLLNAPMFKSAVLFSPIAALHPSLVRRHQAQTLDAAVDGEVIDIPTALIWGRNDSVADTASISGLITPRLRETYVHNGGHEIPGPRMKDDVRNVVQLIRRVISLSSY
ncbi:serine hydrolase-domain-containing protein [Xylaria curta]|nr:serine hydrolase-domain-containing protein [Xylaria curta]